MTSSHPILLCADGSEHAIHALTSGVELLDTDGPYIVTTVVHEPDTALVTGLGMAGGVMSGEEFDEQIRANQQGGEDLVVSVIAELGLSGATARVLMGDAGPQICALAEEVQARAVVIGSRGLGGLKRALLGSVSDYVVRHATCPVIVTGPEADDEA